MARAPVLPGNSTQLERLAAAALADIERVPVPLRELWNPFTCPEHLLPYLAWAFSVDRWSPSWPASVKRAAIQDAYYVHSRKGTLGALRRVVEPLGYLIEVKEWWEESPAGIPGTFRLVIGVLETGISEEMYTELEWLIDDAKPVTRHLIGLAIALESRGGIYLGAACIFGDEIDIYPPQQRDITVSGVLAWLSREHSIDTLDIYHER